MNNKSLFRKSAVALAVSSTALLASSVATVAFAQGGDESLDEIVVTGSRLNTNPNLSAPTPVVTVGEAELENRGTLRVEDLVNVLPQVFPGQAGEVSNGATGTANLNLRGLGAQRTLTLINGRRLPYGSSQISSPNLDIIPSQLVERIDLLTGGASAVYGSDAIGGVANFILKDDFEGFEFDVQAGFSQADNSRSVFSQVLEAGGQDVPGSTTDGENALVSLTWGNNFDEGRGNITLFASFETQDEIVQADRTFSACTLGASTNPDTSVDGFGCVGSANFRLFAGPGGFGFQQEDGTITEFQGGPAETFNFGASNFYQRPNDRINLFASSNYELTDTLELYSRASYVDNESDAQIAPTASFGFGAYSTNCDNPLIQGGSGPNGTGISLSSIFGCDVVGDNGLLPTTVDGITAAHRNVEGGSRNSNLENSTLRLESGLRGKLSENWDFDIFSLYAKTDDSRSATEDFIISNLQQAFFVTTDANGNAVCVDQSNGCVPYNIFQRGPNGESLVTQEALTFLQGTGLVEGETEQISFGGTVQSDLGNYGISSPLSDSGVGVLFGVEYRKDELSSTSDPITQIPGGGFTGLGSASLPISGEVDVFEAFFEAQIPLITDRQFAKELTLNTQYRFSDYSTDGNGVSNSFDTDTYGLSLNWTPVDDVRLRGQFQRAVRAPNVIELFTGQDQDLGNLNQFGVNAAGVGLSDPCASSSPILSLEECARTGVTAAQFGNIFDVISGQTQLVTGGNPLLDTESSDTTTFGVVITPRAIPNLSITIDYFDITVEDTITDGIPAQVALNNCLSTGDSTFCDLITRGPSGSLAAGGPGFGFQSTNLNIAELETSGVDVQFAYAFETGFGAFDVNYAGTFLDSYSFTPFPGGEPIECAGFFGNACAFDLTPDYRHRAVVGWATPWGFDANLTWRHFASVDNIQGEDAAAVDMELASVDYFDLNVNFQATENIRVRAGITNLGNEEPPISVSAGAPLGNGNTFPSIYETSRQIFLGATYNF